MPRRPRTLDAELSATVERLRDTRDELAVILRDGTTTDLPSGFAPGPFGTILAEADRSFVVVMSRVLGPKLREGQHRVGEEEPVQRRSTDVMRGTQVRLG